MGRINAIQDEIIKLDGGSYQKLLDAYLYKKYHFENIQPLGVQTGTNKVTKGTLNGNNVNCTLLLLQVLKSMLKNEFHKTEGGDTARTN